MIKLFNAKTTFEEAVEISRTVSDLTELDMIQISALFVAARSTGNEILEMKCRNRLNEYSQTKSNLKYIVNRMYGKYGVDELMYLYQQYSYDEIYDMISPMVSDLWNELTWKFVSGYLGDTRANRNNFFYGRFLKIRIKGLYCRLIGELAKERYPKLTFSMLRQYVKLRKLTSYRFIISRHTNNELNQILLDAEVETLSMKRLNQMRVAFGYEPEIEEIPLREQPAWKASHRNEREFWKKTKADKINQKEQDGFILYLKRDFDFTDDELANLVNWLMIARYEGRVGDDIPVCESLKNRYKGKKGGRITEPNYIKEMRIEILMNCDTDFVSPVFIHTLESGIGGKVRGQINAHLAALAA